MYSAKIISMLFLVFVYLAAPFAHAWGRIGHSLVGQTAANLVSNEPNARPLKDHAYDLGYYCNTPDFFWKTPATGGIERPQHYMNLDILEKAFRENPEIKNPLALTRAEFQVAFPMIKPEFGGAYWRVREFFDQLQIYADQLRALKEPSGPGRQALQAKWILLAGLMGHYIGDMSMPLHITSDFDGASTNQVGIHSFFEDTCVNELWPKLVGEVHEIAKKRWPDFKRKYADKPVLQMLEDLGNQSRALIPELLAIDKKHSRGDVQKTCALYGKMIPAQIASSSLVLAELYRRALGWTFDDNRFFFFKGQPEYIMPGPLRE